MGFRPEPAVLRPVVLFAHHPGSWVPYYGLRGDRERVLAPRYKKVGTVPEEAAGGVSSSMSPTNPSSSSKWRGHPGGVYLGRTYSDERRRTTSTIGVATRSPPADER